jgi:preprotein translocase subunit SecE
MAVRAAGAGENAPGFFARIARFFTDAYAEMLKVIWPSFDQVRKFTVVVVLTVTAVGIFIWLCDIIFGGITMKLYGLGK